MKNKIVFFLTIFILECFSHPHVWVDNKIKPVLDSEGITGFFVEWIFDETTSAAVLEDFDKNGDGKFSDSETQLVYEETFKYLEKDDYYTRIKVNGEKINFEKPESLKIESDGWVNTYKFFIPCRIKADKQHAKKISLSQYDDTYFIDFAVSRNIEIQKVSGNCHVSACVEKDESASYYFGQITPVSVKIILEK